MSLKGKKLVNCPFKSLVDGVSDFWTVSGSGTNEYYYNQGDVPFEPLTVQENGTDLVQGTLGSLAVGEWAWGDNDSFGISTVYVRLNSATPDPDGNVADFVKASEPQLIFTAPATPTETIMIGWTIANNEDTSVDANIILYSDDGAVIPLATFIEKFTIKGTDSPATEDTKLIFNFDERFLIHSSRENVSVWISENEG